MVPRRVAPVVPGRKGWPAESVGGEASGCVPAGQAPSIHARRSPNVSNVGPSTRPRQHRRPRRVRRPHHGGDGQGAGLRRGGGPARGAGQAGAGEAGHEVHPGPGDRELREGGRAEDLRLRRQGSPGRQVAGLRHRRSEAGERLRDTGRLPVRVQRPADGGRQRGPAGRGVGPRVGTRGRPALGAPDGGRDGPGDGDRGGPGPESEPAG